MIDKTVNNKTAYIKTTIPMPKNMVKFLHNLGLDSKTSKGGYTMAKATIVRALCEALEEIDKKVKIDLRECTTQEDVKQRIIIAIKKYSG